MPKLLVIGHGRHGKDTVCEVIQRRFGLRFISSSMFCAEHVVLPALQDVWARQTLFGAPEVPFYESAEEAYNDRHNHRALWFKAIAAYNTPDKTRLARGIFAEHDIYCGLRNHEEFVAIQTAGLVDHVIWVHRSGLEIEGGESCTVGGWLVPRTNWIFNTGDLDDLEEATVQLLTRTFNLEAIS